MVLPPTVISGFTNFAGNVGSATTGDSSHVTEPFAGMLFRNRFKACTCE